MNADFNQYNNRYGIVFPRSISYASFISTDSQPLTTSAETLVSYTEKTVGTSDIVLLSSTQIQYRRSGVYQFLYSIQVDKGSGGGSTADVEVYIKIDGVALANSSSRTQVTNAVEQLLTCDYILPLKAGQIIEVGTYTTGLAVTFPYFAPSGTAPATPSVIITTQRI
jgi:hypothetical protein